MYSTSLDFKTTLFFCMCFGVRKNCLPEITDQFRGDPVSRLVLVGGAVAVSVGASNSGVKTSLVGGFNPVEKH